MFNREGKIKWMLGAGAVIVVAVVGAAFYLILGRNNFRSGDFWGWKTYKNSEYGFELKYPPALAGKEKTANPGNGTEGGIGFALFKSADPNDAKTEGMAFSADKFVFNPDKSATTTLLIKDKCEIPGADNLNKNIKLADKNISGANFTRIETGQGGAVAGDVATHYIGYVAKIDDVCYRFIFVYVKDDNSSMQTDVDLFEKMISTVNIIKNQ